MQHQQQQRENNGQPARQFGYSSPQPANSLWSCPLVKVTLRVDEQDQESQKVVQGASQNVLRDATNGLSLQIDTRDPRRKTVSVVQSAAPQALSTLSLADCVRPKELRIMTHAAKLTFAFKLRSIGRATLVQCVFEHRQDYNAVCNWIQAYIADQGSAANIKYSTAKEKSPESQSQQQRMASPAYQQPNAHAGPSRIPAFSPPQQQHQQNLNHLASWQQVMPDPISRRVPLVQPAQRQMSPDPHIPSYVEQMHHLPSYSQPHHAQQSFIQPSQYATQHRPAAKPAASRNAYNNIATLSTALNASSQRPLHIPLPPKNRGDDTLAEIAEQAQFDALRGKNDKQAKQDAPNMSGKKSKASKKRPREEGEASQTTTIEQSQTSDQHLYSNAQRSVASIPAAINTARKGKGVGPGRKATAKRSTPLPRLQEEDEENTSGIPYNSAQPAIVSPYSPAVFQAHQRAAPSLSPNLPSLTQGSQTSTPCSAQQEAPQQQSAGEVDEEEDDAFLRRMRESLNKRNRCLPDKRVGTGVESSSAEVTLAVSGQSQTQGLSSNRDIPHFSSPPDERLEGASISPSDHISQQRREEASRPSPETGTAESQSQQYSSSQQPAQNRQLAHARSGIISSPEDSFNASALLAKRRRTNISSICRATPESLDSSPAGIPASSGVPMQMEDKQQQQPAEPYIVNMDTFNLWEALEAKLTKQEMLDLSREVVLGEGFKGRCLDVENNLDLLLLGSRYIREE